MPGDLDKAERREGADGGCDAIAANAPLFDVKVRNRQLAILGPTMRKMLDLDAIERSALRKAQRAHCWAFHQLSWTPYERPGDC
jgi:hypothetical protein